jgi:hypothetical protein
MENLYLCYGKQDTHIKWALCVPKEKIHICIASQSPERVAQSWKKSFPKFITWLSCLFLVQKNNISSRTVYINVTNISY